MRKSLCVTCDKMTMFSQLPPSHHRHRVFSAPFSIRLHLLSLRVAGVFNRIKIWLENFSNTKYTTHIPHLQPPHIHFRSHGIECVVYGSGCASKPLMINRKKNEVKMYPFIAIAMALAWVAQHLDKLNHFPSAKFCSNKLECKFGASGCLSSAGFVYLSNMCVRLCVFLFIVHTQANNIMWIENEYAKNNNSSPNHKPMAHTIHTICTTYVLWNPR